MVVWVFAGGGESEIRGLIPFLDEQYPAHRFIRKAPFRLKPGSRPSDGLEQEKSNHISPGHGRTGTSLAEQIGVILSHSLRTKDDCDLILVIDDLDCHDPNDRRELFKNAIYSIEGAAELGSYVGLASPELEAWIVADWGNTIAKDVDFRGCHQKMRHWLSTQESVPFRWPENFSSLDPDKDSCHNKLSDAIVESSLQCSARARYSKGIHTPRFLMKISPEIVSGKCPLFRSLHNRLCQTE